MNQVGKWMAAAMTTMFMAGLACPVLAGDLTPPGAPGTTMHTLEEIYVLLQDNSVVDGGGANGQALVPKSGQIITYGMGDDGSLRKGVAWPVPRFTDNADGTVTDNLTGLIWLKNANCYGAQTWANALSSANTLNSGECGLSDDSSAGDWRMPHWKELYSLVDVQYWVPALSNAEGTGHLFEGDPFIEVQWGAFGSPIYYWSATTVVNDPGPSAWTVWFYTGSMGQSPKNSVNIHVWPVRGGQ